MSEEVKGEPTGLSHVLLTQVASKSVMQDFKKLSS